MKKTLLMAVTLMLMAACQSTEEKGFSMEEVTADATEMPSSYDGLALNDANNTEQYKGNGNANTNSNLKQNTKTPDPIKPVAKKSNKKIIKTADIRAEVEDLKAAKAKISDLIKKHKAYTFSENTENSYREISTKMTIRMTPENFEPFIKDLEGVSLSMDYKRINAKDVTAQFVDLSARLNTKRDALNRYREILKKANTVEDILKVEGMMRQIVEEIEATEGRLKYLSDQVGYSTINLDIYERSERPTAKRKGFFSKAGDAFEDGWNAILAFMIGLISIWPFLILIGGGIYWWFRVFRKRGSVD